MDENNNKSHEFEVLIGDVTKGGRPMTEEERKGYIPTKPGEVPRGLEKCPDCGKYRGHCVDPNPNMDGLVVSVICSCQHAFCSRCGRKLELQPISNYYDEQDGNIWHVPWFGGKCYKCGRLGMNNSAGEYCHACGRYKCPEKCGCYKGRQLHRH